MSALDLLHALVLDDGRRWGEVAVDWQREDARAVLEPAEGDPRLHWLGRPKGGSKTTDLAAMSAVWLAEQAPAMVEGYAVAADRDQANRLLGRARAIIARTSGLGDVLEVQSHRIVHRASRASVIALEADVASSEGLLSPWFVVDELPNWPTTEAARRMWTSVVSGVPKWPGCRLVVIGHAGDPAHWSRRVLDVALAEGWRVREVPGPLPWMSEADLAMQRALLLPSEFARRHLNVWTAGTDRLTSLEDVRACLRDGPVVLAPGSHRYVAALDVGLTNDRTVLVVAHAEDRGRGPTVVVDRVDVWEGSKAAPVQLGEVEETVAEVCGAYGAWLRFDPYQAQHLAQQLGRRGVRAEEFTFSSTSVGRLALTLFRLLRDRLLDLPDDAALVDELVNVRLVEKQPGVYRMDHDAGAHDDRAVALALAAHALVGERVGPPAQIVGGGRRAARARVPSGVVDPSAPVPFRWGKRAGGSWGSVEVGVRGDAGSTRPGGS